MSANDFKSIVQHDFWFKRYGFLENRLSYDLYFLGIGRDANDDLSKKVEDLLMHLGLFYHNANKNGAYS
jgi:hypothetical protein